MANRKSDKLVVKGTLFSYWMREYRRNSRIAMAGIYKSQSKQSNQSKAYSIFRDSILSKDILGGIKFVFSVEVATAKRFILLFISLVESFVACFRIIEMNILPILTLLSQRRRR